MEANESRVKSSAKNVYVALIGQIIKQVMEFVVRTIFIKTLPVAYLGVNGLFTNLLTYLSLAELGVGSALIYSMYAPMAKKDIEKIKTYMGVYKIVYRCIGIFVLSAGAVLALCLDFFVSNEDAVPHLKLIFMLYVIKIAASYFIAYKKSIYMVDQKQYVVTKNSIIFEVIMAVSRIAVLVVLRNYYAYLMVSIICVYAENITLALKANKQYPYICEKNIQPLPRAEKDELKKNVFAMFMHRVSDVILGSTDNIIMSKMFGLVVVGIYSNYQLLVNVVKMVFDMVSNGIVPNVGNYCASEPPEKVEKLLNTVLYINIAAVSFICICLYELMSPFIIVWIGEEFLINNGLIIAIVVSLYIQLTMRSIEIFRTATGMFQNDKYYAVLQCVINIGVSIILAYYIGSAGIFIGTALAIIFTKFWRTPKFIYNEVFSKSVRTYFKKYFVFTMIGVISFVGTDFVVQLIDMQNIVGFILKTVVTILCSSLLYILCSVWTSEFKECIHRVKNILVRRKEL